MGYALWTAPPLRFVQGYMASSVTKVAGTRGPTHRPRGRSSALATDPSRTPAEAGLAELRLFELFVQEHEADVYTFLLRMVGNRDEAADLTQEALTQTWRTWTQVVAESEHGYAKWCYRIAHNLAIDFLRRKRPRPAADEELEYAIEERVPQPEQVYENRIQANEVREALLGLEEKYREVLLLRFQSDLSYEEIAEALDIPVTTVETRLHRAKNMMREKLGKR